MKAFSLWLFKLCWRREIAQIESQLGESSDWFGEDWDNGWSVGADFALETLHLKEPK